jgi:hypothetical protein
MIIDTKVLNRNQLRWVTGLLTGHCHLKGHLFKMGLTESPTCEWCLEKDESATHILCDCEAIAYVRFRHLGQYFMGPGDYQDAPVSKILHFIRSVEFLEGWNREGCTIDLRKVAVQGPIKHYPLCIHSFIHSYRYITMVHNCSDSEFILYWSILFQLSSRA